MQTQDKVRRFESSLGPLLSKRDIGELAGVSVRTVDRWIETGRLPAPDVRFSERSVRWREETIIRALGD